MLLILALPMSQSRDTELPNDGDVPIHIPGRPRQNPPLVIVSERGRHSQASRRIVRVQAARASAAQSRETRARNRGDRQRDRPLSPRQGSAGRQQGQARRIQPQSLSNSYQGFAQDPTRQPSLAPADPHGVDLREAVTTLKPLVHWITNILQLTADSLAAAAAALAPDVGSKGSSTRDGPASAMEEVSISGGLFNSKQLPITLPRGFAALHTRIPLPNSFLALLSRSACFDYDSPGVSHRLNQLLFDIVMSTATSGAVTAATSALLDTSQPTHHPIQSHLRVASACLAIWSCQRSEGSVIGQSSKYTSGFEAAWEEALELDQEVFKDADAAEAALWAVFIITVTCGCAAFFNQQILDLMHDLRLACWGDVRSVLVNYNYPVTTLDQPCRDFYERLLAGQTV